MNWQNAFTPEIRSRGLQYFIKHRVHLLTHHGVEIRATVKGREFYSVTLTESTGLIQAQCDCPYSLQGNLCKHIFATLCAYFQEKPQNIGTIRIVKTTFGGSRSRYNSGHSHQRRSQYKDNSKSENSSWSRFQSKNSNQENTRPKNYPAELEGAFSFFEKHGCPLKTPLTSEILRNTKKTLMKKIHPDVGGKTEDATQLNHYFDLLVRKIEFLN